MAGASPDGTPADQPRIRAIVADDSVLLRDGIIRLLGEANVEVADAVGDAESALAAVELHAPDIAILDVRMPPTHTDEGIRAALGIRDKYPSTAVLVLSQYVEATYAAELLAANTSGVGYLLKDRVVDVAEFLDAVHRVASGGSAIDSEVVSQILQRSGRRSELDRLTAREREVLAALAEGLSNRGIGEKLVISQGAVEKHISNVFTKLDLAVGDHAHRRVLAVLTYLNTT
jgi:DNA-binding NarL/FixJ family response regulator